MQPVNGKIIVEVNPNQKDFIKLGDIVFQSALRYEINYKEKSPSIATVIEGNEIIREGDIILTHHNLFYLPSPYHLFGNLFSIPANAKTIFIKILGDGSLLPILGNMICKEIEVESTLEIPPELKKFHKNRYEVIDAGYTRYKKGDIVFTRPSTGYEIVYNINSVERRVLKVNSEMVCGVLK